MLPAMINRRETKLARRRLLRVATVLLLSGPALRGAIDRHALVSRHDPVVTRTDFAAPLSVGNGGFAFTADATGLQTFAAEAYRRGFPLETLARWAWATEPNPAGYRLHDTFESYREADGREQPYPTDAASPAGQWLRRNPHDQPLGTIALDWRKPDGSAFTPADITEPHQTLDLWSGLLTSRFRLGGQPVTVRTACAPDRDALALVIDSPLVAQGRLRVRITFPRGHDLAVKNTPPLDFSAPASHTSALLDARTIERRVAGLRYLVRSDQPFAAGDAPHTFFLAATHGPLACTLEFARATAAPQALPSAAAVFAASARHWAQFWNSAAALDLSGSTDPRAARLEARVVLTQYLTAIQSAGDVPPQESGLTCSTWYGKHHTEMIWWHTAHFALWGHPELLEKNLAWYVAHLPAARALAAARHLRGARWAKMVGPDDRESPGGNPLIVWNQPHPIHLAELVYRCHPDAATLERYRELVFATADTLASMVRFDPSRRCYVLGPPLWIAQEIHDPATSQNPTFELAYWRWALTVAQVWRQRLHLPAEPRWQEVIDHLAPLTVAGGRYVALGSDPDTWTSRSARHDHPAMLMALGFLPAQPVVDPVTMNRTLDAVLGSWDWETKIWGWDYPMIAMTATRLGRPADAIDILLRDGPNNRYLANGHCPQRSDVVAAAGAPQPGRPEIAVYLPANGALLSAVALMVAGWDGCRVEHPGFPTDGSWHVAAEGWSRLP